MKGTPYNPLKQKKNAELFHSVKGNNATTI